MTATLPPVVRDLMDENGIKYKYSSFVLNKVKHKIVYLNRILIMKNSRAVTE